MLSEIIFWYRIPRKVHGNNEHRENREYAEQFERLFKKFQVYSRVSAADFNGLMIIDFHHHGDPIENSTTPPDFATIKRF